MLMLYGFTIEVFDRRRVYRWATDHLLVCESHIKRVPLLRQQVEHDTNYILLRCVLQSARVLSTRELCLLRELKGSLRLHEDAALVALPAKAQAVHPTFYLYPTNELSAIEASSSRKQVPLSFTSYTTLSLVRTHTDKKAA